ncbi:MAG TPA: ornithine carbamoyltransferase [Candidatus Acidoferrales bacterium]|jgi:ornithine carbamoyltransferase|nr:ornithine carbamoyltransferase [Candidatus Acidoferrales bacterium]
MAALFMPNQILKASGSDLLRDLDLTDEELLYLLDLAAEVKQSPADYAHVLAGKSIALLFEKPSLRTRLTFELAIKQLGGDAVFVDGPIGVREPLKDVARNLDRWVNGIVARVFLHSTVEGLARWSAVPVINALCDLYHPCQALADIQTLRERFDDLTGLKFAFVGDGNNVAQSLMLTSLRLGMDFALACPPGYTPNPDIVAQAEGLAAVSGASLTITHDTGEAVSGAHAIYADVWASMGQEQEAFERKKAFHDYQVNDALFAKAQPDAVFMHCLPAKRDEEVTDSIMEHARSVVFDQAENRLHAQKALLLMML